MTTIIRYFVPEDRDTEEKPNAFVIYKPIADIKLCDVRDCFPLPGEYHFRFKFELNKKVVWLDFNKEEAKLPLFNNKVIIKVTRLSWNKEVNTNENQVFPEYI